MDRHWGKVKRLLTTNLDQRISNSTPPFWKLKEKKWRPPSLNRQLNRRYHKKLYPLSGLMRGVGVEGGKLHREFPQQRASLIQVTLGEFSCSLCRVVWGVGRGGGGGGSWANQLLECRDNWLLEFHVNHSSFCSFRGLEGGDWHTVAIWLGCIWLGSAVTYRVAREENNASQQTVQKVSEWKLIWHFFNTFV